jgi:hypothetical protein
MRSSVCSVINLRSKLMVTCHRTLMLVGYAVCASVWVRRVYSLVQVL